MEIVLLGLMGLFSIISLICSIIILIHAFKSSVGEGFLCLCVPCYILYYAFAKFEHDKKGLIIAGWLGSSIINTILNFAVTAMTSGGGY
jgi:benzodiazapine receptor